MRSLAKNDVIILNEPMKQGQSQVVSIFLLQLGSLDAFEWLGDALISQK